MKTNQSFNLVEIWGDTVDYRSMLYAILISTCISVGIFQIASAWLTQPQGDTTLLKGYAMLIGLGGCLLAGFICTLLFKPKRIINTEKQDDQKIQAVIAEWYQEHPDSITHHQPSPAAEAEMKALNLYDAFEHAKSHQTTANSNVTKEN